LNDAKKRTAFRAMDVALAFNGVRMTWDTVEVGDVIVQVAQGRMDSDAPAARLRAKAGD
jgi:prophage maintenance system killer protein